MNRVSSINISSVSSGVGEYHGAGINTNSVFDFSFLSLLPVWIVSPDLLMYDVISSIAAMALVCNRRMYAALST